VTCREKSSTSSSADAPKVGWSVTGKKKKKLTRSIKSCVYKHILGMNLYCMGAAH
jgi:hypothetical protein